MVYLKMLPLALPAVTRRETISELLTEENHGYQDNRCHNWHLHDTSQKKSQTCAILFGYARRTHKESIFYQRTEHLDSGLASTIAMRQQHRPPFGLQTGCKRNALKLPNTLRVLPPIPTTTYYILFFPIHHRHTSPNRHES
jgi:hypothetical protein